MTYQVKKTVSTCAFRMQPAPLRDGIVLPLPSRFYVIAKMDQMEDNDDANLYNENKDTVVKNVVGFGFLLPKSKMKLAVERHNSGDEIQPAWMLRRGSALRMNLTHR